MAAKINDGLFIGDFDTSQDVEFLELNKISSLINLAGKQLPNIFASHGIVYMTVNWEDREDFELFPSTQGSGVGLSAVIKEMVHFIDKCQKHGTSVLLFSVNGTGRCAAAASCYLMYKFGWGFEKAYDFLFAKKPDLDLNRGFVEQLFKLDKELRRQKYQSLHNISPLENERLTGWNVDYVLAGVGDNPSAATMALITEEVLMVNSFNNSKLTITTLPGPYESAMRQFKNFKLQFNLRRNQEAGVHLQRTAPKHSSFRPPRGGILKGAPKHCPPHLRAPPTSPVKKPSSSSSSNSPSSMNGLSQSRGSSNSQRVLEDSSSDEEGDFTGKNRRNNGNSNKKSPPGKNPQQQHQESKRGRESPQEDSLMFGGSISLLSAGKDTDDSLYDNNSNNNNNNPLSESSDYYYDRPFQPQESVQSQNSQGSDLYDFVGLESQSSSKTGTGSNYLDMLSLDSEGGGGQPRRREAKDASRKMKPSTSSSSAGGFQDRRVRRSGEAKQSAAGSGSSGGGGGGAPSSRGGGVTPEERLHSLLGDLQRGGGSKKNNNSNNSNNNNNNNNTSSTSNKGGGGGASYESGSKQRADRSSTNGYRSEAKRSGSAQGSGGGSSSDRAGGTNRHGTTVHDVANMNIQPAYYQNGMSVSGQPVMAKPHSTAWGEQTRVQSERKQKTASSGSKQYRSNTAGSTYRHGSPAPQVSAGGLSGRVKQSASSSTQRERERNGSSQPLRRNNSGDVDRDRERERDRDRERERGGGRHSTPSRAGSASRQRDAPGGGSTASSARRQGTPTRERERHSTPARERERQPTPTRDRERQPTPTRQRPVTPDRSRGWKY